MDKKLEKAMNEQIVKELFSSYLYLSMASYFESETLPGMAHWMKVQAHEELLHALKFFEYINDRGGRAVLGAIAKPEGEFESIKAVFEKTLAHEKTVTASINNLCKIATQVNDNASSVFLQWYVKEQVEEEKNAMDILGQLKHANKEPAGILMLDKDLAARIAPASLDPAILDAPGA